jgi:hypothetical protein
LILSVLGQIFHPRGSLVSRAIHDLEVPHLEARDGEEGDFKVDVDGLFLVEVAFGGLDGGQLEICTQDVFSE